MASGNHKPPSRAPRWSIWLVEHLCSEDYQEELTGDLYQAWAWRQDRHRIAGFFFFIDVLSLIQPRFMRLFKRFSIGAQSGMIRSYFRSARRSMVRQPGYTFLNVAGLAVSLAVGLLLVLFVREQRQKDAWHTDSDRLYRVYSDFKSSFNASNALYATSPADLASVLMAGVSHVEDAARVRSGFSGTMVKQEQALSLGGFYADPGFFRIFDFELVAGNTESALQTPGSIVLTQDEAIRLFGRTDVRGETLPLTDGRLLTVTGVLAPPKNGTNFPLQAIVSHATLQSDSASAAILANWIASIYRSYTYVKLREGADKTDLERSLQALIPEHFAERNQNRLVELVAQPITRINLGLQLGNELGRTIPASVAQFMLALAFVLLATSCFNYIGLTISRALQRAREVGIRKVFGAGRGQLFGQFIVESVLTCFVALLVGIGLMALLFGQFNQLQLMQRSGSSMDYGVLADPGAILLLLAVLLVVALAAGFYPAFFISRFSPSRVVRGASSLGVGGGSIIRKSLVVVQFSCSIVFVIVSIVMLRQSSHMRHLDYGFQTEDILNVRLKDVPYDRLHDRLQGSAAVEDVAGTSLLFSMGSRQDIWFWNQGDDAKTKGYIYWETPNYTEVIGIRVAAGRTLQPEDDFAHSRNVLVNPSVVEALGMESPLEAVGKQFVYNDSMEVTIVGVTEPFRSNAIVMADSPTILGVGRDQFGWATLKVAPGRLEQAQGELAAAWEELGSVQSLEVAPYQVQLDGNFAQLVMQNMLRIVGFFAIIALVIACLGLFGVATYNVQRRTREISIRKVLGADVGNVLGLLSKEFVLLMGISLVVAVPAGWYFADSFLQDYAFRVDVGVLTVSGAVFFVGMLALLTIGSQTVRAALMNPVDNLKRE